MKTKLCFSVFLLAIANSILPTGSFAQTTSSREMQSNEWVVFDTTNSPLPDNRVWEIKEDSKGNFWIATSGGLAKYDSNGNWQVFTYLNSTIKDASVSSIAINSNDEVWIGYAYEGIAKFNGSIFINYDLNSSLGTSWGTGAIEGMDFDKNNNLWIASHNGLIKYNGSSFFRYHTGNGVIGTNQQIWSVLCDTINDVVWFGTFNNGLQKFNGVSFTQYHMQVEINYDQVNQIYLDNDGDVWITGYGVVEYDKTSMVKKSIYTSNNGLGDPLVWGISIDHNNKMWIGSDFLHGLFMMDGSSWYMYDANNSGLPASYVGSYPDNHLENILTDEHNNKWLSTWTGVVIHNEGGVILDIKDKTQNISRIDFFPNPTNNYLNVISNITYDLIEIIDYTGRIITKVKGADVIDVQNLSNGLYLVNFYNHSNQIYQKKFIKN